MLQTSARDVLASDAWQEVEEDEGFDFLASAMSAVKAQLEMTKIDARELKAMNIGLGAALNEAAREASGPDRVEAARLRSRRFAAGACLAGVALIFMFLVATAGPGAPRTDEYSADWPLADEIAAAVAAAGDALEPIALAAGARVERGGVDYVVLRAGRRGAESGGGGAFAEFADPFSPDAIAAEPRLVVRPAVFGDYALVLNKYPVLGNHALLVTRAFSPQDWRLNKRDLDALHRSATAAGALGFYNSDGVAGASQLHRHFQLVPTDGFDAALPPEARTGGGAVPVQAAIDALGREPGWRWSGRAPFRPVVRRLAAFAGIAHGVVLLPRRATFGIDFQTDGDFSDGLTRSYAVLLADLGLLDAPPYNLLLGESWMLVVARRARTGAGVDVNALGYAGCLLARDEAAYARALADPAAALGEAAVPA